MTERRHAWAVCWVPFAPLIHRERATAALRGRGGHWVSPATSERAPCRVRRCWPCVAPARAHMRRMCTRRVHTYLRLHTCSADRDTHAMHPHSLTRDTTKHTFSLSPLTSPIAAADTLQHPAPSPPGCLCLPSRLPAPSAARCVAWLHPQPSPRSCLSSHATLHRR